MKEYVIFNNTLKRNTNATVAFKYWGWLSYLPGSLLCVYKCHFIVIFSFFQNTVETVLLSGEYSVSLIELEPLGNSMYVVSF